MNAGRAWLYEGVANSLASSPPPLPRRTFGWLGPGVIMAASGIGASDIVCGTVGGATYGLALMWALALGAFFKFVLSEGLARWQLATGSTVLEGWACQLPRWVMMLFAGYLVLWAVAVSGALVSGCGLAIENITNGAVPRTWGGFAQAVAAFALIWSARVGGFTRVMKPLIVVMFVSVVVCAALTFREPASVLRGLFVPTLPSGGGAYVLSLIGGIGGSVTLLSYNYLLRDEGKVDPRNLRAVRLDLATAYLFTAIFGLSVMLITNRVFHSAGVAITDREAVSRMAGALATLTWLRRLLHLLDRILGGGARIARRCLADDPERLRRLLQPSAPNAAGSAQSGDAARRSTISHRTPVHGARVGALRVSRSAAADRHRVHSPRQPLHPVPRRHAAISEQPRRLPRANAPQPPRDQHHPRPHRRAFHRGRVRWKSPHCSRAEEVRDLARPRQGFSLGDRSSLSETRLCVL